MPHNEVKCDLRGGWLHAEPSYSVQQCRSCRWQAACGGPTRSGQQVMVYHASEVASSLTSQHVSKMLLFRPRHEKHTAALCAALED